MALLVENKWIAHALDDPVVLGEPALESLGRSQIGVVWWVYFDPDSEFYQPMNSSSFLCFKPF